MSEQRACDRCGEPWVEHYATERAAMECPPLRRAAEAKMAPEETDRWWSVYLRALTVEKTECITAGELADAAIAEAKERGRV